MNKFKKAAILEKKQDGDHKRTFSAWHWPLICLYCYQLAMYQVSCFYHKMHDSSPNCYISAPLIMAHNKDNLELDSVYVCFFYKFLPLFSEIFISIDEYAN